MATLVTGRLESGMGYGPCHVLKTLPYVTQYTGRFLSTETPPQKHRL